MTNHFSKKQLIKYVDHSLADTKREEMDLHLNTCRECRTRLVEAEALQRQIHHSIIAKRQQVKPSGQMTFAAIAPGLNRSRRIAMFVKRSYSVLSVATAAIIIIALGVGGFYVATNVVQPETATEVESPSLDGSQPSLDPTLDQEAVVQPETATEVESPSLDESQPSLDPTLDREALGELLFAAVKADDVSEVKRLLAAGADANFETADEQHVCILAAKKGNVDVVELLVEHGCDFNAQDASGKSPLTYAVINDHLAVTEMLLDRGANVNSKDKHKVTLLSYAAYGNQAEMAELLVARGASVNLKDDTGWAPLHIAAENNSREVSIILIDAGAQLNSLTTFGGERQETPLDIAIRLGSDDVAQVLQEAGAK